MATLTVKFDTDNSAFNAPNYNNECARILRKIADQMEREGASGFYETIFDANGNDVGRWAVKEVK
jgi:hypothetical protein